MNLHKTVYLCACVLALFLFFVLGCSDDNPTNSDDGIDSTEIVESIAISDSANDSLGVIMSGMVDDIDPNDSTFRPDDITGFGELRSMYQRALNKWPDNEDAMFGLAFTNMMMFMSDDDFNTLYDEYMDILDTTSYGPFGTISILPRIGTKQNRGAPGIPLAPSQMITVLPEVTALDHAVISNAPGDPAISELQSTLETSLLPIVVVARGYLEQLVAIPDFSFVITPEMQGNDGADSIVVDRSDISMMLSVLYGAEAAMHVFFARNLDVPSYDIHGAVISARQNSDFLTLKSGGVGSGHMSTAKTRLLSAESQLRATITYLLAEVNDDQSNDLIKVYPGNVDDLTEARDSIAYYAGMLTETRSFEVIYNERYEYDGMSWTYTADTLNLDVNLGQFFDDPLNDPKDMIPAYTITFDTLENYYMTFADEHFSRTKYWDMLDSLYGLSYPYDSSSVIYPYFDYHLPETNNATYYELLASMYMYPNQFVFGWDDLQNWYSGSNDPYYFYSSNQSEYREYYYSPVQYQLCFEWAANSFGEWNFPDASMNGLFPTLTNTELKELLFDDISDWEKSSCQIEAFD